MVKLKKSILVLICITGIFGSLHASGTEVNIRFFNKRIYYLHDDPILIQLTVSNNSPETYRFRLADERVFSVDFDVRTMTNRGVEASDTLIRKRTTGQQIFFREVIIEPGESFSFVEDLREYADFTQSGSYIVQAKIYPELLRTSQGISVASNRLNLNIRPDPLPGPEGIPVALDTATNALLVREKLPPDQVVEYMIQARQKEQWEKFFLYLDLEAMLSRDGVRKRQWLAESEEGRQRMLERYRTELQNAVVDGDISVIPFDFTIERTVYGNNEGTVTVLEKFRAGNYTERKRYTYYLQKKDDVWTIIDYNVLNLGTE